MVGAGWHMAVGGAAAGEWLRRFGVGTWGPGGRAAVRGGLPATEVHGERGRQGRGGRS